MIRRKSRGCLSRLFHIFILYMRRFFSLAFVLAAIILSVSASGSKEEDFIGVSIYRADDAFTEEERQWIEKDSIGLMPVRVKAAENRQSIQNEHISQFIEDGAKAIIVNPVDRTASGAIIEKCRKADVPLVFINREPLADDMAIWDKVYYVGARAESAGRFEAKIFINYWYSHPEADKNGDGILQFVIIKGEPGHQDTELRSEYLMRTLAESGIVLDRLDEDTALWERERAEDLMSAFLAVHGDAIEAVFANNDQMALGAIDALKNAGYFSEGKYMPVIGCDAIPAGLEALQDGTLLGTVLNDAEGQGKAAYRIAFELASGRIPTEESIGYPLTDEKYVWIPYTMMIQGNNLI